MATTPDASDAEASAGHVEPVAGEERLYRRIPPGWYHPGKTKKIPQRAFMPRPWESEVKPGDRDGLSINRACLTTVDVAATMPHSGKKCHLCEFGVEHVHRLNLTVAPKPQPGDRSHAVIPELNSVDRRDKGKEAQMEEWAIGLRDSATLIFETRDS
jgi:hypothetical protein